MWGTGVIGEGGGSMGLIAPVLAARALLAPVSRVTSSRVETTGFMMTGRSLAPHLASLIGNHFVLMRFPFQLFRFFNVEEATL